LNRQAITHAQRNLLDVLTDGEEHPEYMIHGEINRREPSPPPYEWLWGTMARTLSELNALGFVVFRVNWMGRLFTITPTGRAIL